MTRNNEIYFYENYNGIITIWGSIGKRRYIFYTLAQAKRLYKKEAQSC